MFGDMFVDDTVKIIIPIKCCDIKCFKIIILVNDINLCVLIVSEAEYAFLAACFVTFELSYCSNEPLVILSQVLICDLSDSSKNEHISQKHVLQKHLDLVL